MDVFTVLQNYFLNCVSPLDFFIPGLDISAVCRGQWLLFYLTNLLLPKPLAKTLIAEKEQWEFKFPKAVISSTKAATTFLTSPSCLYPRACTLVPQLQGRLESWSQCCSLHLESPEGCFQNCPWNRLDTSWWLVQTPSLFPPLLNA